MEGPIPRLQKRQKQLKAVTKALRTVDRSDDAKKQENAVAEWKSQYLDRIQRPTHRRQTRRRWEVGGKKRSPLASLCDAPIYSLLQRAHPPARRGQRRRRQGRGCAGSDSGHQIRTKSPFSFAYAVVRGGVRVPSRCSSSASDCFADETRRTGVALTLDQTVGLSTELRAW